MGARVGLAVPEAVKSGVRHPTFAAGVAKPEPNVHDVIQTGIFVREAFEKLPYCQLVSEFALSHDLNIGSRITCVKGINPFAFCSLFAGEGVRQRLSRPRPHPL